MLGLDSSPTLALPLGSWAHSFDHILFGRACAFGTLAQRRRQSIRRYLTVDPLRRVPYYCPRYWAKECGRIWCFWSSVSLPQTERQRDRVRKIRSHRRQLLGRPLLRMPASSVLLSKIPFAHSTTRSRIVWTRWWFTRRCYVTLHQTTVQKTKTWVSQRRWLVG